MSLGKLFFINSCTFSVRIRTVVNHKSNLDYNDFVRMFRVTPLQYAEMNDKMELAAFIRKEQKRLDIAMGKESDIARWMRLEAARKQKEKLKKDAARKKLEEKKKRAAIAEKKLQDQIANIETSYEPVIGSKVLPPDHSLDTSSDVKGSDTAGKNNDESGVSGKGKSMDVSQSSYVVANTEVKQD